MFLKRIKGQSTAEYAVVLSLVIAAVIGMQIYVKRGLQARVKAGTDSFIKAGENFSFAPPAGEQGLTAVTYTALSQYEPYYQESKYDTYAENIEQEHMGGGRVVKEKVSDVNVREHGGYQAQRGSLDAEDRDDLWHTEFGTQAPQSGE